MYVSVILLPTYQLSIVYPSYPKTHISRFFWLPAIYGPGIHGYLSTRYLWVSVDQISMGIFFLPEGKTVADCLIVIPVLLNFPESLLTIHNLFRPEGKAVADLLIAIPVLLFISRIIVYDSWSFTTFRNVRKRHLFFA